MTQTTNCWIYVSLLNEHTHKQMTAYYANAVNNMAASLASTQLAGTFATQIARRFLQCCKKISNPNEVVKTTPFTQVNSTFTTTRGSYRDVLCFWTSSMTPVVAFILFYCVHSLSVLCLRKFMVLGSTVVRTAPDCFTWNCNCEHCQYLVAFY